MQYADQKTSVPARGFHVWTDNVWDSDSWSEPIYHDVSGIDQDVRLLHSESWVSGLTGSSSGMTRLAKHGYR